MIPLLLIPLSLGWIVARYWLQQTDWPALVASTFSIGLIATLMGTNLFYRHTDLAHSIGYTLALQVLLLAALWLGRCKQTPALETPPRWSNALLAVLSIVVAVFTNAQQIANPDDDYWIHAPLQGLMRHDNFPPFNPFFSDIPMNGHYGRNLGLVIFSYLSGADVFLSQHLVTSALQVLTLWLFYATFLASTERREAALLATTFVFFGINAGGRGGLIDTLQNNNAFVNLYLAFLAYLAVRTWKEGSASTTILGGLTLGSYAIVYETHFGLVFLTILGVTPLLWAARFIDRRKALCAFTFLLISLPLAATQGGPITDILDRKIAGREHTQSETLSKGMQNQAQVVKVSFPKEELFQILLETGEYQRTSQIYTLDTPLKFLYKPSTDRGYAYIWSWDVLKIHFLPLYLLPWSAFVLIRRGSLAGLFFGAFGTIAFLVPALVNFGPIYESEYYRWEFAAALGFSAALGLATATLLEKAEGQPFHLNGSRLEIRPSGKRYLMVGLLTLVNSWACLNFVAARLTQSVGINPKTWLIFPSTPEWLASHPVLNFDHLDYEAATWLEERVQPGDRVLTNFADENNFSILYESTLTGITGARCVGHALPLEDEKIGTTPFRRSPAAQLFWQTQRPEPLAQLQVDWLFVNGDNQSTAPEFPGATLEKTFKHGNRRRYLYSVQDSLLPTLSNRSPAGAEVAAEIQNLPQTMRGGRVYNFNLTAQSEPEESFRGTVVLSTLRTSDGLLSSPAENLQLAIDQKADERGTLNIALPFIAPYDEGEYQLQVAYNPEDQSPGLAIGETTFRSEFSSGLAEIKLDAITFPNNADPKALRLPLRQLLKPKAVLEIPSDLPHPRDVLACWSFYSLERKEFDLPPQVNLERVLLQSDFAELPLVTPERPGQYRLSLYVSPGQGQMTRILGPMVEIVSNEP